MTVTIAAKKNMTKISKEKQYWQQLAKEYEKKIELLKQAKASAQPRKKEQQPILNKTSRHIDNNEVFSTPPLDYYDGLFTLSDTDSGTDSGSDSEGTLCYAEHVHIVQTRFRSLCRLRPPFPTVPISVADTVLLRGGDGNSKCGCEKLLFSQFFPKLNEIERIWIGCVPGAPLDPPMHFWDRYIHTRIM